MEGSLGLEHITTVNTLRN